MLTITNTPLTHSNSGTWFRDLLLLTILISLFFGALIGNRPLDVPDGARYAEIPREMVVTGDYITPRIDGVKYFEKPPLFYWIQAFSIKHFGLHEWAVRLPTALIALLGCLATYAMGRYLFDRRSGLIAATVLATCPLYLGLTNIITLDMVESVFLTLGLYAFLLASEQDNRAVAKSYLYLFFTCIALATLTKGLIGFVLPGLILSVWIMLTGQWKLFKALFLPSGIAIFLLLVLPWHLLVQASNPDFFNFYIIDQHFTRFLTDQAHRSKPRWFLPLVVIAGLFPWTLWLRPSLKASLSSLTRQRKEKTELAFLYLWVILIFAFFTFSKSQLAPYILPIFPPLSLLIGDVIAKNWQEPLSKRYKLMLPNLMLTALFALLVITVFTPIFKTTSPQAHHYLVALFLTLAIGYTVTVYTTFKHTTREIFLGLAATSIAAGLVIFNALPYFETTGSIKPLATILLPQLQKTDEVVAYKNYYQDLPFYLQRRITVVDWHDELTYGQQQEDTHAWMINEATFLNRWQSNNNLYMITSRENFNRFRMLFPNNIICIIGKTQNDVLVSNKRGHSCLTN